LICTCWKVSGAVVGSSAREHLGADGRVRADQRALAALGAEVVSHCGSSSAMLRFSNRVVPVGQVPSAASGSPAGSLPRPAISVAVTRCTKSGALAGTTGGRSKVLDTCPAPAPRAAREGRIDGGVVAVQQLLALLAVGLLHRLLDLRDGLVLRQDAGDGEEAGLHDGVDAPAHAGLLGDAVGVDTKNLSPLSMICCCTFGRSSQTSSGGVGELSRKVPPALALASMS
jgi:hypothetical protein